MVLKEIFEEMPEGWRELKNATNKPAGTIWIANNKSMFCKDFRCALLIKDKKLYKKI